MGNTGFKKKMVLLLYAGIIFMVSLYLLQKPAYNWDILPYMAVVLSYDKAVTQPLHDTVYALAKKQFPSASYKSLTDPANKYRNRMAESRDEFNAQLPFYVVKPLYTRLSFLFYKAGMPLPKATVLPSVLAYFFLSLLLLHWLRKYLQLFAACCCSILLMVSAPLLAVARLSTPDAFSGLLLLGAIYCIVEKRSFTGTAVFLLLALFTRPDNIIPAILLCTVFFTNRWSEKLSVKKLALFFSLMIISCLIITYSARPFGWSALYYPDFAKQLNTSYDLKDTFIFSDYIVLAKSQFMTGLLYSSLAMLLFMIILLLAPSFPLSFNRLTMEQMLSILFLLVIFIRFILHPVIADRLYIPYYLSVLVFLIKKYSFAISSSRK